MDDLVKAIRSNNLGEVQVIVAKNGFNLNAPTAEGLYPIHEAALRSSVKILEHLIEHGADVNSKASHNSIYPGYTALHFAAARLDGLRLVRYLIKVPNIQPLEKDKVGRVPFHLAAFHGNITIVSLLQQCGYGADFADEQGRTPLMLAVSRSRRAICRFLIDNYPLLINAMDIQNNTALHHCFHAQNQKPFNFCFPIEMGNYDIAMDLIRAGAKTNIKNESGDAPLDYINVDFAEALDIFTKHRHVFDNIDNFEGLCDLSKADIVELLGDTEEVEEIFQILSKTRETRIFVAGQMERMRGCPLVTKNGTPPIRKFKGVKNGGTNGSHKNGHILSNVNNSDVGSKDNEPESGESTCPFGYTMKDIEGQEENLPDFVKEKIRDRRERHERQKNESSSASTSTNTMTKTANVPSKCPVPYHRELMIFFTHPAIRKCATFAFSVGVLYTTRQLIRRLI